MIRSGAGAGEGRVGTVTLDERTTGYERLTVVQVVIGTSGTGHDHDTGFMRCGGGGENPAIHGDGRTGD